MKLDYPVRLQVYLAKSGFGSRRTCENLMTDGRVTVNGKVCMVLGTKVNEDDAVYVDDVLAEPSDKLYYYALNKPVGYVCSNYDPNEERFAVDLIDVPWNNLLFHIGRLDKDSSGLILYTNDGDLANRVMHPSHEVEKEYMVETDTDINRKDLDQAAKGNVPPYSIKSYELLSKRWVKIILTEGKNREIRNMLGLLGYNVSHLVRTRIGGVELGKMPVGRFRTLSKAEIESLSGEEGNDSSN
ncbi:MAG: pseudouridine synthase [Sphaerochaetaceae bacterium]|jgi:23S rRNA pseudouridine2605 synthase|nr:pseudouridine synthase [Sphaerochaetaceae bacterium]MDD3164167.1 pseudouridine synthase [Sphaerochaetaceae bacterium]MDD4006729.1 pseudouridine synthase [Sphaerochaetaceae bacterium]MDD4396790.1 pseudouridine synthase [Sphaerochaetaceae bacterium]